jgi:immune inhibitor A
MGIVAVGALIISTTPETSADGHHDRSIWLDTSFRRDAMMQPTRMRILLGCFPILLCLILQSPGILLAQMPPHPDLLDAIKSGRAEEPMVLQHLDELRKRGIDAPWNEIGLNSIEQLAPGGFKRSLGPATINAGQWRALVILVDFSDKVSRVTASSFDSLLFAATTSSLRDYYRKVTYYALDIVTVHFPGSTGWQRAPNTYAYYVNGNNGFGTYPRNAQRLTEDAVHAVDSLVDFKQYDNNGDKVVDALFVVHAGQGAEYTNNKNDIWSHAWSVKTTTFVDSVYVRRYSMEPEYWSTAGDMTIGVYAHELGHAAFGLPDLYDRDYSSNGVGKWSLMAGGSWNGPGNLGASPSFPDAWSHAEMGYLPVTNITVNTTGKSINAVENTAEAFRLWTNGTTGTPQYFLVENRQQTGYDTYLPNGGLNIFHIDENVTSQNDSEYYPGHTTQGHYLVAMEQADGLYSLEKNVNRGDAGDPYPGNSSATAFGLTTTPNSRAYNSDTTFVSVQNISASALAMTADLNVSSTNPTLSLGLHLNLEGPYSTSSHLMANSLKSSGILAGHFGSIPIPGTAVDSITVEVRNAQTAAASTIRKSMPGWLLANGSVRSFSDTTSSSLKFVVPEGDYYIVVTHRTHLSVMSATTVHLSTSVTSYDFTTGLEKYFGGAAKALETGVFGLFCGDTDGSGDVAALDRVATWNNRNLTGYSTSDVDLSGAVDAIDRVLTWNNRDLATHVP